MRLLVAGAFPYPHDQGSQVYLQEQAIALRDAGAEVTLLTYGGAIGPGAVPPGREPAEHWRALDGFDHRTVPEWLRPGSLRSGPNLRKPLADLALAAMLNDALSSARHGNDAFDAILTHNAEATLVALASMRRRAGPPIVYCAHTLLEQELRTYANALESLGISRSRTRLGTPRWAMRGLDRIGGALDRHVSTRVDGWIALTHSARRVIERRAKAPGCVIPPPLPDPVPTSDPTCADRVCRRLGLVPGRFFLYVGNLDGYQALETLEEAAGILAEGGDDPPTIVVASHRRRAIARARASSPPPARGLTVRWLDSAREMQALLGAARACVVPRRIEGGFPIKLVNALALGTPPVVFQTSDWGLEDGRSALACRGERPAAALARAIERLSRDDALAARLGAGARALYLERHRPERVAADTLTYLDTILGGAGRD
jgi:glycosyltransferase involved in cell wall biosynthesis